MRKFSVYLIEIYSKKRPQRIVGEAAFSAKFFYKVED